MSIVNNAMVLNLQIGIWRNIVTGGTGFLCYGIQ